ncbi:MAG: PASTA domain-containing protein [Candidatus Subteraquimicrobiales bacterium]|nr:PASTA domain-containing protein [Candidatus Subteraquimicrobiales bacterium]
MEVPELVGLRVSKARNLLKEIGLYVVVRDSLWSETDKVETVLEQYPESGAKLKPEGTVYLVVSKGSKVVAVPTLVGRHYEEAFITLRNSGLRAVVADSSYSNSYPVNTVLRSSPTATSKVEKTSVIKLYLSRGRDPLPDSLKLPSAGYQY